MHKKIMLVVGLILALLASSSMAAGKGTHALNKLFFLHHSVGRGIIMGYNDTEFADPPAGTVNIRSHINNYNAAHKTNFQFWDYGYNLSVQYGTGLTDQNGNQTGIDYAIPNATPRDLVPEDWSEQPGGNTTPGGLQALWCYPGDEWASVRSNIMKNFEVIAFKSCYYDSKIETDDQLDIYRTRYLAMRKFFDAHPEKLFVVVPPPPWNPDSPEGIKPAEADRARIFANWLKSDLAKCPWYRGTVAGYLNGKHSNIVCFDLFNELAGEDNFLKPEYRYGTDNHPNSVANNYVAGVFSQFLIDAALKY
jgi:hypothetical protein